MSGLHIIGQPVGSKQGLMERGISLRDTGCCAPKDGEGSKHVRGCPYYDNCRETMFGLPQYGGFCDRGEGTARPHNIGYYLRLSAADGGASKNDVIECFNWFASGLYARFRAQQETGEKLRVIAQEGEPIQYVETIPVDPNNNKSGDTRMKRVVHKEEGGKCACGTKGCVRYLVPTFPEIDELMPGHADEEELDRAVRQRERQAMLAEEGLGTDRR
jgi:hypothetical protein